MHIENEHEEPLATLARQLTNLSEEVFEGLQADGDDVHLDNTSDLLANQAPTRLFRIKRGQLRCMHGHTPVYVAEAGDLVGLPRSLQIPEGPLQSEGPVQLTPYQRDTLMRHVHSSTALQTRWTRYLLCLSGFFREALARETPGPVKPATGFLQFDEGDIIIRQGDQADCVYTMLEGSADALCDGVKVGEIKAEEMFGAMAVFTKQTRGATVRATSGCSVLAVRKDEFLGLVAHQPQVGLGLMEEMADKINHLNSQLLKLQK